MGQGIAHTYDLCNMLALLSLSAYSQSEWRWGVQLVGSSPVLCPCLGEGRDVGHVTALTDDLTTFILNPNLNFKTPW
jgi:hypothetical protein